MSWFTTHATPQGSLATSVEGRAPLDGLPTGSLGRVLKAALLSGLIAGAVVALFHLLLIEPVIERAVGMEGQLARHDSTTTPIVSRGTQRVGLVAGLLVFGAVWGTLFGVVAHVSRALQPRGWLGGWAVLLMALGTGWTVSVFPFLRYPANPPGVGEPETIGYRQALYFGFMALSILGTALAGGSYVMLRRRAPRSGGLQPWIAPIAYAFYATIVFVLMPRSPDPIRMPAQLILTFRVISLTALILFWAVLGGVFGRILRPDAATS